MRHLVHGFLRDSAAHAPTQAALICEDRIVTFADLDRESDQIALDMQTNGVSKGDRVGLLIENSRDFVRSLFAVLKTGAVFVVINPTTK